MCTVLVRVGGDSLIVAAMRDEFLERPWDPPGGHWPDRPGIVGGRDRIAGGTWLAVRPSTGAVAALLNGVRLPPPADGVRPSRGGLPLTALTGGAAIIDDARFEGYDGFHLMLGTRERVIVWSWDGVTVKRVTLEPGNHIIVNDGVDTMDDPLVPHFAPLLGALPDEVGEPWRDLLKGDGLALDDPRALVIRHEFDGHVYGSSSASLIAVNPDGVRFDFTATPANPAWSTVL